MTKWDTLISDPPIKYFFFENTTLVIFQKICPKHGFTIPKNFIFVESTGASLDKFSEKMQDHNLNDVSCCQNGYKLVVGNNHIDLTKTQSQKVDNNQCAIGNKFTEYVGGGYSVYRSDDGWVLKNGSYWTQHDGGEECCPRDKNKYSRGMIKFNSDPCTLSNENRDCSWPQGIKAEIHCK